MSWSQPAFEDITRLVNRCTGLTFAACRAEAVEMGIRRAMARAGARDAGAYHDLLAADAAALDNLLVELTVGETYFFREPGQFEFIRRVVLPDLRRRRGSGHVIRAWSAGCASGEEPYSLAILFSREGLAGQVHVLATDISRAALTGARRAVYGEWSLRGDGALLARPYLAPAGRKYRLNEEVCRHVTFEYLNLALDVYPSLAGGTWGLDLILCRNVLIYFDGETINRVARRFYDALAEGGWLIMASSDPPLGTRAPFEAVVAEEGVFYRRQGIKEAEPVLAPKAAQAATVPAWPPAESANGAVTVRGPAETSEVPLPATGAAPAAPARPAEVAAADPVAEARAAFTLGDYARVVRLTAPLPDDAGAAALHVRALANLRTEEAEAACAAAAARHPLSAELNYLHAVLLLEHARDEEAARAVRRVLYLDRTLAMAHYTLGSILRRRGDPAGAARAYRNARDLCASWPKDRPVPLADGEPAGRLAIMADAQIRLLKALAR